MTGSDESTGEPQAMGTHDQPVVDTVLILATEDPDLTERQRMLVLASLESDDAIADELDVDRGSTSGSASASMVAEVEPVGAFLTSISVTGFRGIGGTAKLNLQPGPGLTVVAGRNGSGKSSFAEALEYALTGESYRWKGKSSFWKDSWRNLHHVQSTEVRIQLAEEGVGRTEIGVEWATDGELGDSRTWTQRYGKTRTSGVGSLGWDKALELYRPILSYDELGQRLDGTQTDLYRSLESILGLDQIADGIDRLGGVVKRLKGPTDQATAAKSALKALLESATDERARLVLTQLRKQKPDLDLMSGIATGVEAPDQTGAQLRALSELAIPDKETVDDAATALLAALQNFAGASAIIATRADDRRHLLEKALEFRTQHGEQTCPVCAGKMLDDAWRERVTTELAAEKAEVAAIRTARNDLVVRRDAARAQVDVPTLAAIDPGVALTNFVEAEGVLKDWRQAPADDVELAQHLTSKCATLISILTRLRDEAAARLSERDDGWRHLAERTAVWLDLRRSADSTDADFRDVKVALAWLRANAESLRNKRLEPLAEEARKIWARLRQESSIDLDKITLSGQRNRGKVNLTAEIDGVPTEALPVMSQGELNAIALALFLPRATMSASPLRFVVLDDPVQAMDPAKVNGLTEVLVEYAKERQVVVFSHDDRLTESVRRTAPTARILQVERGANSKVEVVECQVPARRYLKDARELLQDKELPDDVLRQAIPGYARLAIEAASHEVYFRRRLTKGDGRHEVEGAWEEALTSGQKIALALYDAKRADLLKWSRPSYRRRVLDICGRGAHRGLTGAPEAALDDLAKTVEDLLAERP